VTFTASSSAWATLGDMNLRALLLPAALTLALGMPALAASVNYPAGSTIDATVSHEIASRTARDNDAFTLVTPSGSTIYGHLSEVVRATPTRKAHLKLNIDAIRFPNGARSPLHATLTGVTTKRPVKYGQAAAQVVGGMIVGNILGKTVGTNAGGLIGLAGGALLAANTAYDLVIPAGAAARITLTEPLTT
jgi:hypothetical protein